MSGVAGSVARPILAGGLLVGAAAILLALGVPAAHASSQSAQAAAPAPVSIIASAARTIDRANADWLPAMERGDAEAVAADYAEDGVFITSKGTAVRGRAAIAALYRTGFATKGRVVGGGLVQEGVTASNGMIYEWGHAWVVYSKKDGQKKVSSGPYLTVWRRDATGAWVIARNIVL
jgi:uncharacterized protein (TIGR02246 family)